MQGGEMMNDHQPKILIVVKDESAALSLRDLFLLQTSYEVLSFSSPAKALSEAENFPVDLVISDYRMPEIDGAAFLMRFKKFQPQAVLVLLTEYSDRTSVVRAAGELGLYLYIDKPWDKDHLLMVVRNGLEKCALHRALRSKFLELDKANLSLKSLHTELVRVFM
jgi:response regulator RpfG family c-di-GMP phosphodiesterase